jgi:transketolase
MMANIDGACYQRTLRAETKVLYKYDEPFEEGGFKVLREGRDACFIAAGYMVHECLKAADELAKNGRKATVIDAYGLPMKNTEQLLSIAARSGGTIVTVEDNYTGGLDAEVAMAIAESGDEVKLKSLYVAHIPKSGREPQDVLDYLNLGSKAILQAL